MNHRCPLPEAERRFQPLVDRIDALLDQKAFVRIAIDGNCASGKSTLGECLRQIYDANLFHMDDYFLPFARKTPERLAEPGGNVDYERFWAEVASHCTGASSACRTQSKRRYSSASPGQCEATSAQKRS